MEETAKQTEKLLSKEQKPEQKKSSAFPVVIILILGCFLFAMLAIGLFVAAIFFTSKRSTEKARETIVEVSEEGAEEIELQEEEQLSEDEATIGAEELGATTAEIDAALEEIDQILNEMDSASRESDTPPNL